MPLSLRVTLSLLRPHENTNILLCLISVVFPCCYLHAKVQYTYSTIFYQRVKHRPTFKSLQISSHLGFPQPTSNGETEIRERVPSH